MEHVEKKKLLKMPNDPLKMLPGEQRQHDQAGHDVQRRNSRRRLPAMREPMAEAEHYEVQRRRDHWRDEALPGRAQNARHLETIDRPDTEAIERERRFTSRRRQWW